MAVLPVPKMRNAEYSTGRYAAGRLMYRYADRKMPTGLIPVQWCHGWPGAPLMFPPSGIIGQINEIILATGKYLPFAADQGGPNEFGKPTTVPNDIQAAFDYIAASYNTRTDVCGFICYSMGFMNASSYTYANQAKVRAQLGVAGLTNGVSTYNTFGVGSQGRIDMDASAAPSANWAAVDAVRSPINRLDKFVGVRVEMWQGSADTTVLPADTQAFTNALGAPYHELAGYDHGTVWNGISAANMAADFLASLELADWS